MGSIPTHFRHAGALGNDSVPLNVTDEYLALSETDSEPWSVYLEASVGGLLEEERLRLAIQAAFQHHPLTRAHLVRSGDRLYWLIDPVASREPFSLRHAETQTRLDSSRSLFLSEFVPLDASPPVRVRIVRTTDGDHVMLNINHAVCDGLGALRLMQSIARAYIGAPDPVFTGDARREWRLERIDTPVDICGGRNAVFWIQRILEALTPARRLAPQGGAPRPGYGVEMRPLELAPIIRSNLRRKAGATIGDVLLAALHRSVGRWNTSHGVGCDRLCIVVPINSRGEHQEPALVGNFVVSDTVSTWACDRTSAALTLGSVRRQTSRFKQAGAPFATLMQFGAGGPAWVDRRMPWLFDVLREKGIGNCCAIFSNVGRADHAVQRFGPELPVTALWLSAPVTSPVGISLGVVSHGALAYLALRYRWPRLNSAAATSLLDLIVDAVTEFC